jgi:hypothetical protein
MWSWEPLEAFGRADPIVRRCALGGLPSGPARGEADRLPRPGKFRSGDALKLVGEARLGLRSGWMCQHRFRAGVRPSYPSDRIDMAISALGVTTDVEV